MKNILILLLSLVTFSASAQIGYQVAILNSATGEPRAFESVNVDVTISDSQGTNIFTTTQSAFTNEFGIASLTIGDDNTFASMDWSKLPLFISASVDGKMIGKTQILSVPVAEYAKKTGTLTKEILMSKVWKYSYVDDDSNRTHIYTLAFKDNSVTYTYVESHTDAYNEEVKFNYLISGNIVILYGGKTRYSGVSKLLIYIPGQDWLASDANYFQ